MLRVTQYSERISERVFHTHKLKTKLEDDFEFVTFLSVIFFFFFFFFFYKEKMAYS